MLEAFSDEEPIGKTLCHILPDLQHLAWLAATEEKRRVVFCVQSQSVWKRELFLFSLFTAVDTSYLDFQYVGNEFVVGIASDQLCLFAAQRSLEEKVTDSLRSQPKNGMVRVIMFYEENGPRILSTAVVPEQRLLC